MKKTINIEPLREEQIEALQKLAIRTFKQTYAAHNEQQYLDEHIEQSFNLPTLKADFNEASNTYLVAIEPGQNDLLGYVKLRTGQPHKSVGGSSVIEIERIYVEADAIGLGVGAALMTACIDFARSQRHDCLWLGVWQFNQRAVDFYKRWGFAICGEQVFNMGSDAQADFVMAKRIS